MKNREYMSVFIKSNGKKFSGVYIKNGNKQDFIITCEHGISSEDNTKIKVFTKCKLKESELVIKKLVFDKEKDIAILVLEKNLDSEIRDCIPNVILDESVEESMQYKMSGFPISTLGTENNALKEIFVTLNSKDYGTVYRHKIILSDYDKEDVDEDIVDNLDGFSGSPIYETLKEEDNLVLLKGIYLGIDEDKNIFKIDRVASVAAILYVAKKNSIDLECNFENYLFLELQKLINSILKEEVPNLVSGRLQSKTESDLKKTTNFLKQNKESLVEMISQFLCKNECLKEDIVIAKPRLKELILTLIYIIDKVELKGNSLVYNNCNNFLFNPNKVTQRPLNIVLKNITKYIFDNSELNYRDGNALVYYDIDPEMCMNLCHQISVNTIDEGLFSCENMKDDILSINEEFTLEFKCSACSSNLRGILKNGEKIWGS